MPARRLIWHVLCLKLLEMALFNTENKSSGPLGAPKNENWRLEEGVAYFEQMLEVMSEDRTTLEFLDAARRRTRMSLPG